MKKAIKIFIGLLVVLFLGSSCNKYVMCPAYADDSAKTESSTSES